MNLSAEEAFRAVTEGVCRSIENCIQDAWKVDNVMPMDAVRQGVRGAFIHGITGDDGHSTDDFLKAVRDGVRDAVSQMDLSDLKEREW